VNFSDGSAGGTLSANTVVTSGLGRARVNYTTSTKAGTAKILGTVVGMTSKAQFTETVTAGPAASIDAISGSGQTATVNTALPSPLVTRVKDQYGNPVPAASVSFSDGASGGSFSANPVITDSTGTASVTYTTSSSPGQVTIGATVTGVSAIGTFTVSVQ
jgi:Bacterial Ig-like domain (group 1)